MQRSTIQQLGNGLQPGTWQQARSCIALGRLQIGSGLVVAVGLFRPDRYSVVIHLSPLMGSQTTVPKDILWNSLCKGIESSNCSRATEVLRSGRL